MQITMRKAPTYGIGHKLGQACEISVNGIFVAVEDGKSSVMY